MNVSNDRPIEKSNISQEHVSAHTNIKDSIINKLGKEALENDPQSAVSRLLYGKEYVPIKVKSETGETKNVFVKIEDVSKELGISKSFINNALEKGESVESLIDAKAGLQLIKDIDKKQLQQATIDKITKFIDKSGDIHLFKAMSQMAPSFTAVELEKLVQDPRFQDSKMQKTLIKVGNRLETKTNKTHYEKKTESEYGFVIDEENKVYIRKQDVLGRGGFKKVLLATSLQDLDDFVQGSIKSKITYTEADKLVAKYPNERRQAFKDFYTKDAEREISRENMYLELFKGSPGIVESYKMTIETKQTDRANKQVFIQKKYEGDGTLLLKQPPEKQRDAMLNVCKGLKSIQDQGYSSNDHKLENVVVDSKGNGFVTDFGWVRKYGTTGGGTRTHIPPNCEDTKCDKHWDEWSFGVSLLQLSAPDLFPGYLGDITTGIAPLDKWLKNVSKAAGFIPPLNDIITGKAKFDLILISDVSQDSLDERIRQSAENTLNDKTLTDEQKADRLAMLAVAQKLLRRNPDERMSLGDAQKALER